MGVSGWHENIPRLEIATSGAAQSGHMPVVEDGHVCPAEIAADEGRIRILGTDARQHHEAHCVMRAAPKWPAPGNTIAALDGGRRADRTGRAGNKYTRVGKPVACKGLSEVAADPAHAAAVADEPANRTIERRGGLDDAHELEGRQLESAERVRQPQAEQAGIGERCENRVGQASSAVELAALRSDQRGQRLDCQEHAANPVWGTGSHVRTGTGHRIVRLHRIAGIAHRAALEVFQRSRSMIVRFPEVLNLFRKSCKKCSLQAMTTIHEFGPYRLDVEAEMLFRESEPITLGRRAVMLLRLLVERAGTPVSKHALMQAAWPGLAIEESNLTVQIAALRRTFADVEGGATWIETLPRRGYRYVGPPVVAELGAGLPMSSAPAVSDRPSLAVLPFSNLSGDPGQDYFSDGMTGDIIAELSRFRSLFVVARHSSFAYKGKTPEIKRVGRELGVRYVAEGCAG